MNMRRLKSLFITTVFIFLAFGTGYSQSEKDAEILENARGKVQDVAEELNVNEEKEVLLVRATFSYNKRKMQIKESDELDMSDREASLEKASEAFKKNVRHALGDDEQLTERFFELYDES